MSISLEQVLIAAGYDVRNDHDDAEWLMSHKDEFEEIVEAAEKTIDEYDCYEEYLEEFDGTIEELLTFDQWRNQ